MIINKKENVFLFCKASVQKHVTKPVFYYFSVLKNEKQFGKCFQMYVATVIYFFLKKNN